jgi:hypothetical protein
VKDLLELIEVLKDKKVFTDSESRKVKRHCPCPFLGNLGTLFPFLGDSSNLIFSLSEKKTPLTSLEIGPPTA